MEHPVRFAVLQALNSRVASPNELAGELEESVGVVAYHVRHLRDIGAIELVDTAQRRGATEHFYTARVRAFFTDEEYERLDPATRRELFRPTVKRIAEGAFAGLEDGGFDDAATHAAWVTLDLDPAAHEEATTLLRETIERLVELNAEVANRVAAEGATTARYEVSTLMFGVTPGARKRRARTRR